MIVRLTHTFNERDNSGRKIYHIDVFGTHSEECDHQANVKSNTKKYIMKEVVKENADRKNEKIIDIYNEKIAEAGFEEEKIEKTDNEKLEKYSH